MAIKGITKTLGDGKDYVLAPLTLGAMEDFEEAIAAITSGTESNTISTMIDVAHSSLKRNYPKLTREEVRELIDLSNMEEVFQTCMNVTGMVAASDTSGEVKRPAPKARRR